MNFQLDTAKLPEPIITMHTDFYGIIGAAHIQCVWSIARQNHSVRASFGMLNTGKWSFCERIAFASSIQLRLDGNPIAKREKTQKQEKKKPNEMCQFFLSLILSNARPQLGSPEVKMFGRN